MGAEPGRRERRKRHHYLPESYLLGWADASKQVAVRRRDSPDPFVAVTRKVAVEAGLYDLHDGDDPVDALEVALSELEGPLPGLLDRLRSDGPPRRTSTQRGQLAQLMALQLVRTPEHLDQVMFPEAAAAFTGGRPVSDDGMRSYLRHLRGEEPTVAEVQGALTIANYTLSQGSLTKRDAFEILFRNALEEIRPYLAQMAWSLERACSGGFWTTDRPVTVWRRRTGGDRMGTGLTSADEVWFPVDAEHLLVLRPRFPEHRTVVAVDRVQQVNAHLARSCYRLVISRPQDSASLAALALRRTRPALRFNTGPGYEQDAFGNMRPTGTDIVHIYAPYADE